MTTTLAACGPELSAPVADPTTAAVAVSRAEIHRTEGGLEIRYILAAPTREVRFVDTGNVRDAWSVVGADLQLHDDRVQGREPFSEFTIRLAPDRQPYDRVYPSLTAVADGFVMFGPAVRLADVVLQVEIEPGEGGVALPNADALSGYVYVGPAAQAMVTDGVHVVGITSVAPWLAKAITREVTVSLAFYREVLGASVKQPMIFVSDDVPGLEGSSFHGDVTDNDVIFLRFSPDFGDQDRADASAGVSSFVRHESFHLWNREAAPDSPPWLREGGAEYAAIVSAVHGGVLSPSKGVEQVSWHLAQCQRSLGDAPFAELPPIGQGLYNCGVVVQWIADLEARNEDGRHDTFWLWSQLLQRGSYDEADFRALTGPVVSDFLDAPDGRWTALPDRLRPFGVEFSTEPTEADWRSALLTHLMSPVCQGTGWWTESGFVRLDTEGKCPGLPPEPEVVAAEDVPLFGKAQEAFAAAAKRCTAGEPVRLQTRAGPPLQLPCASTLAPPAVLRLTKAPDLALAR